MTTERLLIQRAKLFRDSAAFSRLVKIHQGRIRAFLVRLTRDYDRADDLAQDTFIKAYQKLDSYSGSGEFRSWLFAIAYHCFLQQQRNNRRRLEVTEVYNRNLDVMQDRYDGISSEQMDLESALSKLRPEETVAITLCHSFGFSHQEAAHILGIPLGTVKTNILRGKEKLIELLSPAGSSRQTKVEQS